MGSSFLLNSKCLLKAFFNKVSLSVFIGCFLLSVSQLQASIVMDLEGNTFWWSNEKVHLVYEHENGDILLSTAARAPVLPEGAQVDWLARDYITQNFSYESQYGDILLSPIGDGNYIVTRYNIGIDYSDFYEAEQASRMLYGNFDNDDYLDILFQLNSDTAPVLITQNVITSLIDHVVVQAINHSATDPDSPLNYEESPFDLFTLFGVVIRDVNGDGIDDIVEGDNTLWGGTANEETLENIYYGTPDGAFTSVEQYDFVKNEKYADVINGVGAPGNYVVGASNGTAAIDEQTGASRYTMDLTVPKGFAGIQPKLSLIYSSSFGPGYLGEGFIVTGDQSITRCNKQFLSDASNAVVDKNSHEFFCLNGQRLLPTSSSQRLFKTHKDSNARITSIGGTPATPDSFKVEYMSGEFALFGSLSDSKLPDLNGVHVKWGMDKYSDPMGNYYEVIYDKLFRSSGSYEHRIKEYVMWSEHADLSKTSKIKIKFSYSKIADTGQNTIDVNYWLGAKLTREDQLDKIATYVGSEKFREYNFTYQYDTSSTNKSKMTSVVECGSDNSCLYPTVFDWNVIENETIGFNLLESTTSSEVCSSNEFGSGCDRGSIQYADFNGDGYLDMCFRNDAGIRCQFNDGNNRFDSNASGDFIQTNVCADNSSSYGVCNDDDNFDTITYQDFNLDGRADIAIRTDSGIRIYYSEGLTLDTSNPTITSYCNNSTCNDDSDDSDEQYTSGIRYPELNGDQIPDICWRDDSGIKCVISNGFSDTRPTFNAPVYIKPDGTNAICGRNSSNYGGCNDWKNYDTIKYTDFNTDGLMDLVVRMDSGVRVFRSTGENFIPFITSTLCGNDKNGCEDESNYKLIHYPDINADGLADVCFRSENGIQCAANTGYSFDESNLFGGMCADFNCDSYTGDDGDLVNDPTPANWHQSNIQFVDLNGDGKDDIFYRDDRGFWKAKISAGDYFFPDDVGMGEYCRTDEKKCYDEDEYMSIRFLDLDGDGDVEFTYNNDSGQVVHENKLNKSPTSGYLKKATNGFGLEYEYEYKLLRDQGVYEVSNRSDLDYPIMVMPKLRSIPVVNKIYSKNGQEAARPIQYTYSDMAFDSQNVMQHGFLGVTTINEPGDSASNYFMKTVKDFSINPYLKGMVIKETLYGTDGNQTSRLLEETTSTWQFNTFSENANVYSPYLATEVKEKYDITTANQHVNIGRVVVNNYVNDLNSNGSPQPYSANQYGYITKTQTSMFDASDIEIHKVESITRYKEVINDDMWRLNLPERTTVTKKVNTTNDPNVLMSTKVSSWTYDDLGMLATENIEPDSQFSRFKSYTYNKWGLRETETISGTNVNSIASTLYYDDRGQNTTRNINDLGHESSTKYHSVLGLPIESTDINGLVATVNYDGFGRAIQATSPFGVSNFTLYRPIVTASTSTDFGLVNVAHYKIERSETGAYKESYLDPAGKVVRTRTLDMQGKLIYQDFRYFPDSALQGTSQPYYMGSNASSSLSGRVWSQVLERDARKRVTQYQDASGNTTRKSFSGLVNSRTNVLSQTTRLTSNMLDQLVSSHDASGANDGLGNSVSYQYDADGNRIAIVDDQSGHKSESVYDVFGQRTLAIDPQKGRWSYHYNSLGQLILQTNGNNQSSCFIYDELGRALKRVDMYTGISDENKIINAFASCAFAESTSPTLNQVNTWQYDTAPRGDSGEFVLGALHRVIAPNYQQTLSYDEYGRVTDTATTIKNKTFNESLSYDGKGRPLTTTYASGQVLQNIYNKQGHMTAIEDVKTGKIYWQAEDNDALGNITQFKYGNEITTNMSFDSASGLIESSLATLDGVVKQNWRYQFDEIGNLEWREDQVLRLKEDYNYDNLNRLKDYSIYAMENATAALHSGAMTYSANGNIETKTGVGSYSYTAQSCEAGSHGGGLHAVASTTLSGVTTSYCYDANGNMVKRGNLKISYSQSDKPLFLRESESQWVEFAYDVGQARMYRKDVKDGVTTETYYVGGYQEVHRTGQANGVAAKEQRHFIGGAVVLTIRDDALVAEENYLHKDHLGSTVAVSDVNGNIIEQSAYDPWGKKRNLDWSAVSGLDLSALESKISNQGFGGHEQIDGLGLIHMGGRIYDPHLARFLGADPFVQAPKNYQSLNRYSYVLNNPLSLTDPSGYLFKYLGGRVEQFGNWVNGKFGQFANYLREQAAANPVATQVVMVAGCVAASSVPGGCAAFTAVMTTVLTRDLRQGAKAGALAMASELMWGEIGDWGAKFGEGFSGQAMRVGLHIGGAYVQARAVQATGGESNIQDAMIAAAVSKSLYEAGVTVDSFYKGAEANSYDFTRYSLNALEAAVIGGYSAYQWGDGDWQSGAVTASFARLFNDVKHEIKRDEVKKRYSKLESRIVKEARAGAVLSLSSADVTTIIDYMSYSANWDGEVWFFQVEKYYKTWTKEADTFIYKKGLAGRRFYVQGIGMVPGGHINYIGIGAYAAKNGWSKAKMAFAIEAWNGGQAAWRRSMSDIHDIHPSYNWAKLGYDRYNSKL